MSGHTQTDLVLGTAGHIDHGKSSLVLALTGTDPDRLAEEKQRGITIELGFARLDLPDGTKLGVVDVPGHERFVRQMIAGSTGIDLALLCIAADDGVMPQTVEHLAVLELLGIRTCVVALTKTDLVDEEWALFMADEVRGRLSGTPYAEAEIVPVSSRTGASLPSCRRRLARRAHDAPREGRHAPAPAVDRVVQHQRRRHRGHGHPVERDGAGGRRGGGAPLRPAHACARVGATAPVERAPSAGTAAST